jgi:hypothetical protein
VQYGIDDRFSWIRGRFTGRDPGKTAKAVLATLWAVYDENAALMQSFYRERMIKLTKATLQKSSKLLITGNVRRVKSFAHPLFLGGLCLIGTGAKDRFYTKKLRRC